MNESIGDGWFREAFERSFNEEADRIGRFNLAIFGKTGVGKSTLVNAIFGEDRAQTGIGEPVTPQEHLYLHRSGTLGVLDTRGLEIGRDTDTILAELGEYLRLQKSKPLVDQVHLAWYCVRAGDRRFEETEAAFVRELRRLGLPVILVLTQVPVRSGVVHPDAVELARRIEAMGLPIAENRAFMTMAVPDDFAGSESHGLEALLDATFQAAPSAVGEALAAAQQIDLAAKRASARKAIQKAVAAAGAAGAAPIPFADAVVLVPIQMGMMAAVARIYGLTVDKAATASLAATVGATSLGRSLVANLVKFVPGGGTLVGGSINATVASSITYGMGEAWVAVNERLAKGQLRTVGGALDNEAIRAVFVDEFKIWAKQHWPRKR